MTPLSTTTHITSIDWEPALRLIVAAERIVLTTHVRADTDGIGSEIALQRQLERMGKDARILNHEELAPHLRLLDPDQRVRSFTPEQAEFVAGALVIVLDLSELQRLGPFASLLSEHGGPILCIDHHINDDRRFATYNCIDAKAPSTGVLVWDLLRALDADIDQVTAQAIYATIVADTGSFRFSNTTSDVHRLAAELIAHGATPPSVGRMVLAAYNEPKMRLLGRVLSGYSADCDGRLAWFGVSRETLAGCGAREADIEGLVEYLRLPDTVEVALFFVELEDGRVKASFRSEEGIDVNSLARVFGGGGHKHASGATLSGPLERAMAEIVTRARSLFR